MKELTPKSLQSTFWANLLTEVMELLAFGAIYITNEVQAWPFMVSLSIFALRLITRLRFRTVWIVSGFLFLVFLGFQLAIRLQIAPIIAAAHVAPIALSWIGLTRGSEKLWGWRMGLGFIALILASALSPDFSVTLFIISFIMAGSTALSCRLIQGTLPKGFIRSGFYQSGILILTALLIFPLIPRMQGRGGGTGSDSSKSGYTEDVNLSEWSRVSSRGSTEAALRVYGPNGEDPSRFIPSGFLRTRVLNILGENRWDPLPTRLDAKYMGSNEKNSNLPRLTIAREMIGPANLPVPYGAKEARVELSGYRWNAERTLAGEFREGPSRNLRFNYSVAVDMNESVRPTDRPTQIDVAVPEKYKTPQMKSLVEKVFKGTKKTISKIQALEVYFRKENFQAVYAEDAPPSRDIAGNSMMPIERFLFVEKNGHCELFASSYAILLRMAGVPTRLVAGFRVSRNSIGDVLTVRQSDAHAWLEAYIPELGNWMPIDPTPRVFHTLAITDWFRDTYDWASAKWTQYILNYGDGENSLRAKWEGAKKFATTLASGNNPLNAEDTDTNLYFFVTLFLAGSAFFSFTGIMLLRRLRRPRKEFKLDRIRTDLVAEREKFDALKIRNDQWMERYHSLRFGDATLLDPKNVQELRIARKKIKADLKKTA